ncbi:CAP-Gly domain-containing linker protein 1-like [Planoprotostelium fungivorum]|uniref:CAP-Gly domain-containing linker protein 1-like n=1 Tax=Planoprotostelium fungivorum TaxID=1890364 RepID=A0A2P6NV25_9EUKA|nr:CAP-Gly domain-containing linker protein 1-like [Planoprotostelium fungivorum]
MSSDDEFYHDDSEVDASFRKSMSSLRTSTDSLIHLGPSDDGTTSRERYPVHRPSPFHPNVSASVNDKLKQELANQMEEKQNLESQLEVQREYADSQRMVVEQYKQALTLKEAELNQLKSALSEKDGQIKVAHTIITSRDNEILSLKENLQAETSSNHSLLKEKRNILVELENVLVQLKSQEDVANQLREHNHELSKDLQKKEKIVEYLNSQIVEKRDTHQHESDSKIEVLSARLAELQNDRQEDKSKREKLKNKIRKCNTKLKSMELELKASHDEKATLIRKMSDVEALQRASEERIATLTKSSTVAEAQALRLSDQMGLLFEALLSLVPEDRLEVISPLSTLQHGKVNENIAPFTKAMSIISECNQYVQHLTARLRYLETHNTTNDQKIKSSMIHTEPPVDSSYDQDHASKTQPSTYFKKSTAAEIQHRSPSKGERRPQSASAEYKVSMLTPDYKSTKNQKPHTTWQDLVASPTKEHSPVQKQENRKAQTLGNQGKGQRLDQLLTKTSETFGTRSAEIQNIRSMLANTEAKLKDMKRTR